MGEEKPAQWRYSAGGTGYKVHKETVLFLRRQMATTLPTIWDSPREKKRFTQGLVKRWPYPLQATKLESSRWLRALGKVLQDVSMVQDWEKPCLAWINFHYTHISCQHRLWAQHCKGFPDSCRKQLEQSQASHQALQHPKVAASPCCETGNAARGDPNVFGGIAWRRRGYALRLILRLILRLPWFTSLL